MNKDLFKLAGTLIIISVIAAIALTFVYEKSSPLIEENKLGKLKDAIREVMPEAEKFEEVENLPATIVGEREGIKRVFRGYDKRGDMIGIIVLSDAIGFNDFIHILFGLNMGGEITKVKILEYLETPGLGDRITEDEFLDQFEGKSANLENIDAITGATISSKAVIERVKEDAEKIVDLMKKNEL
jgi:electron transport complex protein RnfG